MAIMNWCDKRWGEDGASLWLLRIGRYIFILLFGFLGYALVTEDLSDATIEVAFVILMMGYLLDKAVFAELALKKIKKQVVNASKEEASVIFQCYFGKVQVIQNEQLVSLEKCDYGFWYLHFSYLSKDLPNHCLTTKDGQKFYISGDMPEVDSLIQVLHKIIDKNKEL